MTAQYKAALTRALIMGLVAAGFAAVTWASANPKYAVPAAIFSAFLVRFAGEGGFDSQRAAAGDVRDGDVVRGN